MLLVLTKFPIVSGRPTRSTSLNVWSSTVVSCRTRQAEQGAGLAVDLGDELDLGRLLPGRRGTAVNVPVAVVNVWPIVAPGMSGSASCMPLPVSNWNQ